MGCISLTSERLKIPLLSDSVSAGFPSPADDYTEENIDLNEHLISNPFSTFFLRVKGHSMVCLLYTSPSPRDVEESRMPSSA